MFFFFLLCFFNPGSVIFVLFLPLSFILPRPSTSNRTLMGPYGVDRAVHSLEFTDCENGLGKYLFSLLCKKDTDSVLAKNKDVKISLGAVACGQ